MTCGVIYSNAFITFLTGAGILYLKCSKRRQEHVLYLIQGAGRNTGLAIP
ncbi:Protein of unknown function [Pyronema omphalodes CBS 100304]|uniref:Uncharacterized protein n=1 Tax=Pyronema omphalodes (strain CBS 100304) TaxID=1076935 RepID=U4L281_PYROM|nr:Protein of unknown function [Pyronema omphalodes CBS 100304]